MQATVRRADSLSADGARGTLSVPSRVIRELLLEVLQPKVTGVPWTKRIRRLSGQFSLTTVDARVLMFLYIRDQFTELDNIIDEVDEGSGSRAVAVATRCAVGAVRGAAAQPPRSSRT